MLLKHDITHVLLAREVSTFTQPESFVAGFPAFLSPGCALSVKALARCFKYKQRLTRLQHNACAFLNYCNIINKKAFDRIEMIDQTLPKAKPIKPGRTELQIA